MTCLTDGQTKTVFPPTDDTNRATARRLHFLHAHPAAISLLPLLRTKDSKDTALPCALLPSSAYTFAPSLSKYHFLNGNKHNTKRTNHGTRRSPTTARGRGGRARRAPPPPLNLHVPGHPAPNSLPHPLPALGPGIPPGHRGRGGWMSRRALDHARGQVQRVSIPPRC